MRVVPRSLAFLAFPVLCVGQHTSEYVATDDGSRLFFISTDRIVGTSQSFRSKLFAWDVANGVRLVYEAPEEYISGLTISGDGALAVFRLIPPNESETRGALLYTGTGLLGILGDNPVLSRNGRFLYHGGFLLDRTVNGSRPVPRPFAVGNDGSILYGDRQSLHRVWPDGTDRVVWSPMRNAALVSADENADRVVILRAPDSFFVLTSTTGKETDLTSLGARFYPLLSPDGSRVAFRTDEASKICSSNGSNCKLLPSSSTGIGPVALSRDGAVLYADSREGIERVDTASGRAQRAFSVNMLYPLQEHLVPGSLVRFYAINAGDHITLNGRDAPLLSAPDGLPIVQIPWELTDEWVKFTMYGGVSPFETFTQSYPVSDFYPQAFPPGNPELNGGNAVYRLDWTPATSENPAAPGEIVQIYAVGLGAVDCPVPTGKPAPIDRECRIIRPVDWRWLTYSERTEPAEVLFAGLAPGMVGVYQINVRVPAWGYGWLEFTDGLHARGFVYVPVR